MAKRASRYDQCKVYCYRTTGLWQDCVDPLLG